MPWNENVCKMRKCQEMPSIKFEFPSGYPWEDFNQYRSFVGHHWHTASKFGCTQKCGSAEMRLDRGRVQIKWLELSVAATQRAILRQNWSRSVENIWQSLGHVKRSNVQTNNVKSIFALICCAAMIYQKAITNEHLHFIKKKKTNYILILKYIF